MKLLSLEIEKVIREGTARLLARANDYHSLTVALLEPRISSAVEKYLVRAEEEVSPELVAEFVDGLIADDLCLIVACEQQDQNAWRELVERFSTAVRSAARAASSNEDAAEDLAQSIWAELYGLRAREDGKPAGKLGYYSGRGSLAGWLRAVVAQLAIDQYRKQARLVQADEDADLDRLSRETPASAQVLARSVTPMNPEQMTSNKVAGSEVQKALARSIKKLNAEDRLLVKLYYFDDLRLRDAGAVLGVHEATASRRLTRIHKELRVMVEGILIDEHGWTKSETERAFSEVALNLQTDIEALLTVEGIPGNKRTPVGN